MTFEVDYTLIEPTTFTGLHIHNAPPGSNGSIVIDTGITAGAPVTVAGSGKVTRVVSYSSVNTAELRSVTGLLAQPESYYVNIHSTTNPGGL